MITEEKVRHVNVGEFRATVSNGKVQSMSFPYIKHSQTYLTVAKLKEYQDFLAEVIEAIGLTAP